jgi:hypothetical protein
LVSSSFSVCGWRQSRAAQKREEAAVHGVTQCAFGHVGQRLLDQLAQGGRVVLGLPQQRESSASGCGNFWPVPKPPCRTVEPARQHVVDGGQDPSRRGSQRRRDSEAWQARCRALGAQAARGLGEARDQLVGGEEGAAGEDLALGVEDHRVGQPWP